MSSDETVFAEARALPATERGAFLGKMCAEDPAQRVRVEELLAGFAEAERALPTAFVPRETKSPEEKPSDKIGRYKLLQKIGEGGCGVVWMAEQEEPVRRRVALKVIKLGMDTKEVIARFGAERQALALMDHPNIAKVFDAGATDTGRPYFVMELVRGVPITRYCDEANLSTADRLALFSQVCHAIQHAHEKGIVHRDIKPSNILIAQHDHLAVPKVIDFGIAKATQGRLTDATLFTAFEQFIGTPAYMSPEQAEFSGLEVDTRSDVYSLGVLLYELLAGRPPFDPKSLQQAGLDEIRRIIREVDPPRPSTRLSTLAAADRTALAKLRGAAPTQHSTQLSGDLDWIVMHCLEKDRARRYATASDLAFDLGRHLRHEPVVARPPSVAYRTRKFLRRHRLPVAVGALVIAGMIASAVVSVGLLSGGGPGSPSRPAAEKSIAVLPFTNRSTEQENEFFTDGFHDNILTSLTSIGQLQVVPGRSVMEYRGTKKKIPQIARELNVAYVLEGSVQRAGNTVRITGKLIRAAMDEQVWAKNFDREMSAAGYFAVQSELAQAIAGELKAAISPQEKDLLARRPTENIAALDLYLKARAVRRSGTRADFQNRERWLQTAVDLDPTFAMAWGELAVVHSEISAASHDLTPARLAKAKAAIERALALAPESPEVIRSAGVHYQFGLNDPARASEQFEKLLRLQPNDMETLGRLGTLQFIQGRWPETIATHRTATLLYPSNADYAGALAGIYGRVRRFEEAIAEGRRAIRLRPGRWEDAVEQARLLYCATGSTREMEELLARLEARTPQPPEMARLHMELASWRKDYVEYLRLDGARPSTIEDPGAQTHSLSRSDHTAIEVAEVLCDLGDKEGVRARLGDLSARLRARLELDPTNTQLLRQGAVVEAILGNKDEALRRITLAAEIIPEASNAFMGVSISGVRARVYAWIGDKDRAIDEIARLLRIPSSLNVHLLRVEPAYASLRGDPRWEALLADPKNNAPLF